MTNRTTIDEPPPVDDLLDGPVDLAGPSPASSRRAPAPGALIDDGSRDPELGKHQRRRRFDALLAAIDGDSELEALLRGVATAPAPPRPKLPDEWGEQHVVVRPSAKTEHGYRYAVAEPAASWRTCPVCHDERWIPAATRDEYGYSYAAPCRCRGLHERIDAFNGAQILDRFAEASLTPASKAGPGDAGFDWKLPATTAAYRPVREYVVGWSPKRPGLVLWGTCGAGKSHLAYAIARRLTLNHAAHVKCVVWDVLLSKLQATFGRRSDESESDVLAPYLEADLLVVDEVGGGDQASEWNRAVFDRLIRRRLDDGRTFICTTNLVPEARHRGAPRRAEAGAHLAGGGSSGIGTTTGHADAVAFDDTASELTLLGRFGAPTYSRLVGQSVFVPMHGDDYRERGAAWGWRDDAGAGDVPGDAGASS